MDYATLWSEQAQVLRPGSLSVEACPGAGKTRSLVARYVQRSRETAHGIALLSFTNRAVREIRHRCADQAHLLRSPNYVGNFDGFLQRFIVTPALVQAQGRAPLYLRTWHDLRPDDTKVRISRGVGIDLSSFVWTLGGPPVPVVEGLSHGERQYLNSVTENQQLGRLLRAARQRLDSFIDDGVVDAESARFLAYNTLATEDGPRLLDRLSKRFVEVIVDEFQDCDENEHAVLAQLAGAGIDVVVVADPDQAIYEFRGASPGLFATFASSLPPDRRLTLSTNYRSTLPICVLASSLRVSGNSPILPSKCPPAGPPHIFVIVGSPDEQRTQFLSLLEEEGIPATDCVALAHKRKDAMVLAAGSSTNTSSAAKGERVALAAAVLSKTGGAIEVRVEAMRELENIVLSCFDWDDEIQWADRRVKLEHLGKTKEWLRVVAARLLKAGRSCLTHEALSGSMRAVLTAELSGLPVGIINLSANFTRPSVEAWNQLRRISGAQGVALPFDTIHGAKGSEHPGVLIAIAGKVKGTSVLDDWENDANTERRRVLYVGATRAQSLLALAVSGASLDQLRTILDRDGVRFKVVPEGFDRTPATLELELEAVCAPS